MRSALLPCVIALAGCPRHDKPSIEPATKHDAQQSRLLPDDDSGLPIVLPPARPVPTPPAGLPPVPARPEITADAVALGELLFFDARLSSTGKLSCASCHDPSHGYSGGNDRTSAGVPNMRRTPALVNLAWANELGWDGRFSIVTLLPAHVRGQLGDELEVALHRISELPIYRAHLARVGGTPTEAALQALLAFTLTRYEGDSPWDRRERNPAGAPDPIARGYKLFSGKAQCAACHTPPLYTDFAYHRVKPGSADLGRSSVDKTHEGAFKTPTLRGAASRSPYFHNGSEPTLERVVDWYATRSGADSKDLDPIVSQIHLSLTEQQDLVAFLGALSSSRTPASPVLP